MVHAELTVAAIVKRDSHYLIIEELAHGRRVLNQPAGHVEPGETILDAAIRETREESAWRFHPRGFIGMYYWPHADGRTTLRVALAGDVDDHAAGQPLDDGIIATHWLTRDALAARSDLRSALVLQSIDDFESHDLMPLDRVRHMTSRS
ncbi:NUDIX hydrolase [Salinisphaera sp. SWV1]|uniref:NUDIX hydrolase n=1 Tax=Salinisphaera sp. SWV1 TaxID=3454139 RepID=UPI003F849EAB